MCPAANCKAPVVRSSMKGARLIGNVIGDGPRGALMLDHGCDCGNRLLGLFRRSTHPEIRTFGRKTHHGVQQQAHKRANASVEQTRRARPSCSRWGISLAFISVPALIIAIM
jgi:hypothetical protein